MNLRGILTTLGVLLLAGSMAVPGDSPLWMALGVSVPGALLLAFILIDRRFGVFVSAHLGEEIRIGSFLRRDAAGVGSALLWPMTAALLLPTLRHMLEGEPATPLVASAGACFTLAMMLHFAARRKPRPPRTPQHPLEELYHLLEPESYAQQLNDARDFQRLVGFRLMGTLWRLWFLWLAVALMGVIPWTVLFATGWFLADGDIGTYPPWWPRMCRWGVLGAFATEAILGASAMLAVFRVVAISRRTGRPPKDSVARHFGRALETLGPIRSIPFAFLFGVLLLTAGAVGLTVATMLEEGAGATGEVQLLAAVLAAMVVLWLGAVLLVLYMPALFCYRDAGWAQTFEANFLLLWLERGKALRKALRASFWMLTIVRIPAAVALVLSTLDRKGELIAALMEEKPLKDAIFAVKDAIAARPTALEKPYQLLEEGRYLDALNLFQMFLRRNRTELRAVRGECIALLMLGNVYTARDRVEVWINLAPDDHEPQQVLEEIRAGLWSETGEKYREAKSRSIQEIGQGVIP